MAVCNPAEQAMLLREPVWDRVTRAETISEEWAAARGKLATSARAHDWRGVFATLSAFPGMVNCSRLCGMALYGPLHHAAWAAPIRAFAASPFITQRRLDPGGVAPERL